MRKRGSTALTGGRAIALAVICLSALAALLSVAAPALAEDITPPALTAFSLSPSHVDTTGAAQTVTITLAIEETQSGIDWVQVVLVSLLNQQIVYAPVQKISSDATHWSYAGTATLPKGSLSGVWSAQVLVKDGVGNLGGYMSWDIDAQFGAGSAEVMNDSVTCDSQHPQVTAVQLSPAHVDTSQTAQQVDVTLTLTDDETGVDWANGSLVSATSSQQAHFDLKLVSGDERSGVWRGTTTLPRWSRSGVWRLMVNAVDHIGNAGTLDHDLSDLFGSSAQIVNDAVADDHSIPTLTGFSITPVEFDTESGATELSISASATDDLTGVKRISVQIQAMLSYQMHWLDLQRVAGTPLDGTWTGTITLPQGAEVGLWATQASVEDALGNWKPYSTDELSALLPGAPGIVLANTALSEQVTVRKDWTLSGEKSSVTFPAGTVVTRKGGGQFAFYKMVAVPFEFDGVPTTDLDGIPVATLRFGIPGLDLSFSRPVTVRMQVGREYNGYLVQIQSLTETGEAWTDETMARVANGEVTFTVTHATRFAASTARPRVTSVSPRKGRRGTRPIVRGDGFGRQRGRSIVLFGGRALRDYGVWTPTYFRFGVPKWAKPGRYRLAVRINGVTTKLGRFTVTRR